MCPSGSRSLFTDLVKDRIYNKGQRPSRGKDPLRTGSKEIRSIL